MLMNFIVEDIDVTKTPARKNDAIATALLKKSEDTADFQEKLKLLGQSLSFSSVERIDSVLRRRKDIYRRTNDDRKALSDLQMIVKKTSEDEREIADLDLSKKVVDNTGQVEHSVAVKHKHLKLFTSKVNIRKEAGRGRLVSAEETS